LLGGTIGGLLAYFLDPARGHARRVQLRDQSLAWVRRMERQMERYSRKAAADAQGARQRAARSQQTARIYDDVTLAEKVESEIFRDPSIPKGLVNINVEDGIVVLRGEVPDSEQIRVIERRAEGITGVLAVESLLHLPGTPAPNKAEARSVS
jgi:osmotically-inducible protein OsmY